MSRLNLSIWLEQWSKAGAGPNFRIEDPLVYIQNFNWISNWIEMYFKVKILDQLGILVTVFFVTFFYFLNVLNIISQFHFLDKKILFLYNSFYYFLYLVFKTSSIKIWRLFYIIFNIIYSISILFNKIKNRELFLTKFRYFVLIVIIIFNFKNFTKIQKNSRELIYINMIIFFFFNSSKRVYRK